MASAQIPAVITYHKPGTKPPLYVAGTFSDPQWQPQEMDHTRREDGEYDFKKEIRGEPGSKIQYKFRLGDGNWWVLKDDGPTVTDSAGNTNHLLEIKPQEEPSKESRDTQGTGENAPMSYAKVAAKHVQPSTEEAATDRSGTGTPIFAKVAAEVADSAELLHEEVPDRERPQGGAASRAGTAGQKSTAETVGIPKVPESRQSTIVILEPPPDEGRPAEEQPRDREDVDDQEGFIADKSPLFAHECAGLYESDEESVPGDYIPEDYGRPCGSRVEDIDPDQVDLNDPTLERFPSNRDDIMEAVLKLETGLPEDQAEFDGNPRSPVVNAARRGTEDITGDFTLSAPYPTPAPSRRASKKSPGGSVGSIPTAASLHSISEAEEPVAEEEDFGSRPAVVFTNPLKPRPKHLKLPNSEEDEGVALPDGVSPRTVKPMHRRIATPEYTPPHSPTDTRDTPRKLVSAEAELDKHKERSMQAVGIRPAPQAGDPDPDPADLSQSECKETDCPGEPSYYAQVASTEPTPAGGESSENKPAAPQPSTGEGPTESKGTTSDAPRARRASYAEVAASKSPPAEEPGASKPATAPASQPSSGTGSSESKDKAQQQASDSSKPRRLSYAEVAASKPSPAPPTDDKKATPRHSTSGTTTAAGGESSTSTARASLEGIVDKDKAKQQLRKRVGGDGGGGGEQQQQRQQGEEEGEGRVRSPESGGGAGVPAVRPKKGGAGWVRAIFRFVFVDLIGRIVKRVLRFFGLGGRREAEA